MQSWPNNLQCYMLCDVLEKMDSTEIKELFDVAQHGKAQHKKYLKTLHNIYKQLGLNEFLEEYMKYVLHAFHTDVSNGYAKSILNFASAFCVEIVTEYEHKMNEDKDIEEYDPHPFFFQLVNKVLKYVPLNNLNVRYHACEFLAMILGNFGSDIAINDMICDRIQQALLDRTTDPKPQVRTQAIKALLRLQDPFNAKCPVIDSFTNSIGDPVASVRKVVVESMAPCQLTFPHIINRLRDVDHGVRAVAFTKISKIPPRALSIANRRTVVMSGILETNAAAKKAFQDLLLAKWLKTYDSNVVVFMTALKLDANEEDVKETEAIYERLLPIIFHMLTLQELVVLLGLDDHKLIQVAELNVEKISFWNNFIEYVKNLNVDMEEDFDDIMPALTDFVKYIDCYIDLVSKRNVEYWEHLEYQQILRKLFELLLKLDISDEFGRSALQTLVKSVLTNVKLEPHVIAVIIKVYHTIEPGVDKLAYELCTIIAEIKEPLVSVEIPAEVRREREVQVAQLKVRLHILTDEMKKAFEEKKYELMENLSREENNLQKQIEEADAKLNQPLPAVRKPRNDMETVCRCMDIILSLMEHIPIDKLPVALLTFKDGFFKNEEIDPRYSGAYAKIFRITCVYSILDKDIAVDNLETICTPVMVYHVSPVFEPNILQIAVSAISDLMRVHGPNIFNTCSTVQPPNNGKETMRRRDRTLYCEEDSDSELPSAANVSANTTPGVLVDIMLNMLDDDVPEIREAATVALTKLVVKGICVNSSLITRLLLKWFNPSLNTDEKSDQKIQRYIGAALTRYFNDIKGSFAILEKAIIPTLCFIGNAPKTSPLAEVEYDDVLQCIIQFTRIRENETMNVHKSLAYSILSKLSKSREPSVRILTKMLTHLDISTDEPNVTRELSELIEVAQKNITDKTSLTYLKKCFNKFNGITNDANDSGNTLNESGGTTRTSGTSARGRKQSCADKGLATIKETDDETNENNSESATTSKRARRPSDCRSGDALHTIEEQQNDEINGSLHTTPTPAKTRRRTASSSSTNDTLITIQEQRSDSVDGNVRTTPTPKTRRRKSSTTDPVQEQTDDRRNTSPSATRVRSSRSLASNTADDDDDTLVSTQEGVDGQVNQKSSPLATPRTSSRRAKKNSASNAEIIQEQQREDVGDNSYDIQTPTTSNSQSSSNSRGAIKKTASLKRKKSKGSSATPQKSPQTENPYRKQYTTTRAQTRSESSPAEKNALSAPSSDSDSTPLRRSRRTKKK